MTSIIVGATGLVGSALLQKLLAKAEIEKVCSVGRRSVGIKNPKLQEIIIADLSELKVQAQDLKADLYFCCLGTTMKAAGSKENFKKVDFQAVIDFAEIAKANEALFFAMVSASGADSNSNIFYSQVKGDAEAKVQNLGIPSLVIMRPSLLVGERKEFRMGELAAIVLAKVLAPLLPSPIRKRIMTSAERVAQKMLDESHNTAPGTHIIEAKKI